MPNVQEMDHAKLDRGRRSGDDQMGKRDGALADNCETSQLASDLIAALGCRKAIEILRVVGEELPASAKRSLQTLTSVNRQCEQRPSNRSSTAPTS